MGKLKNALPEEFFDELEAEQEYIDSHDCHAELGEDGCSHPSHPEAYENV